MIEPAWRLDACHLFLTLSRWCFTRRGSSPPIGSILYLEDHPSRILQPRRTRYFAMALAA